MDEKEKLIQADENPCETKMQLSNFTYKDSEQEEPVKIAQIEPQTDDSVILMPATALNGLLMPDFLAMHIGKYVRVDFLIGNNIIDRTGRLVKVSASCILLKASDGNNILCDTSSIKFAEIMNNPTIVF